MTHHTLISLKEALQHPFAPETIQFLPKEIRKENGHLSCLALPYANKRVYEDRLNALVFGEWSSPYTPPYAQGNKLIIPATVIILGVAHTDYGEAFLEKTSKNGTTHEDENTATEAYSQAFRRACAKFLLGRYLYDLPKLTLPYNPETKQIALSKAERIAWVEKLYQQRGLLTSRSTSTLQHPGAPAVSETTVPRTALTQSAAPSFTTAKTASVAQKISMPPAPPPTIASAMQQTVSSAVKVSKPVPPQPTNYPNDTFLDWVAVSVERDPERIQGICTFYQVAGLAHLTNPQRTELTHRLRKQANDQPRQSQSASPLA